MTYDQHTPYAEWYRQLNDCFITVTGLSLYDVFCEHIKMLDELMDMFGSWDLPDPQDYVYACVETAESHGLLENAIPFEVIVMDPTELELMS